MSNINALMNNYIKKNNSFIKEKNLVLESFRVKEDLLKNYDEILSELEKTNSITKIDSFENIKEKILMFLSDFDTENIEENIQKVESVIAFLLSKENELKKLSDNFYFTKKSWLAFLKRRNNNNKDSLFINEINEKIQLVYENFYTAGIDDLGRLEQSAEDLKQEVLKIINIFEEFYITLDNYIFIGKDAISLKEEISEFLNKDFYESSVIELLKRKEKLYFDLNEIINNETKFIKKALPVVKITKRNKSEYYFYTLKFDDYILEFLNENINDTDYIIENTDKLVYIDNYPEKGIFKIIDIRNKLSISESHFETILEFEKKSGKMFFITSFIFLFSSILSILNIINMYILFFLIISISGSFILFFKGLLNNICKKNKTPNAFFFIPVNYYFLKEGDENFNYKELIFNMLIKADKTILKEHKNVD